MKFHCLRLFAVVSLLAVTDRISAEEFSGAKSSWHGFDRYDFLMDKEKFTIHSHKAGPNEGDGVIGEVEGLLRCVVVVPREAAPGKPWSWQGYYFNHEPQTEVELLRRGFHIGFVLSDAGPAWDAWYKFLTEKYGLSKKPAFVGMSRGGRNAYTWATANPDKVSCLYVDNPVVTRESLMKLDKLAEHDVPLLHVCGSLDRILHHTEAVEGIYHQLGGRISVLIKDGVAHHPHSLRDPTPIADFIIESQTSARGAAPKFVPANSTRTSFYNIENKHRDLPKEGLSVVCRGPWFSESYDRYEFRLDGIRGFLTVVAPVRTAPGKPWVFRGNLVNRDSLVDFDLLAMGFHIVIGPVPSDTNGPIPEQWNAVYKYYVDEYGFSKRPVIEGSEGSARDALNWAVANPDKVDCFYAENPIMQQQQSREEPAENLEPLAKAKVPVLLVSGSGHPFFSVTRRFEKQYKESGGSITIIEKPGDPYFRLSAKDREPVVEFIWKHRWQNY